MSDIFVTSLMDAQGRGILMRVREDGEPADLTGATAYLVWTHRQTGKRGTQGRGLFQQVKHLSLSKGRHRCEIGL